MKARIAVAANGTLLNRPSQAQESDLVEVASGKGRLMLTAPLDLDLVVHLIVDSEELAAVTRKPDFGFKHLRALIDALPRCQVEGGGQIGGQEFSSFCPRAATTELFCDEHAKSVRASTLPMKDRPYAPVLRHIQRAVEDFERDKKVPEGDP